MGLIGGVLQPVYEGFPIVLMSPFDFLQRPYRWLNAISKYRANISGGPNFAYDLCCQKINQDQLVDLDLSCWEIAFNGSEPISYSTMEKFYQKFKDCGFRKETFYPCYGLAEATLLVSGGLKNREPVTRSVDKIALQNNQVVDVNVCSSNNQIIVGCGRPLTNQDTVIVDIVTRKKCDHGLIGEIWLKGPSISQGYWGKKLLTQETYHAYLDSGEGPFLRTGDLGFIVDNELFITGRLKDLIVIRGRNYYPQDIERVAYQSHPALREGYGAAFSILVEAEEQLVVVQEIERHYQKIDLNDVIQSIKEKINEHFELEVYEIVLIKPASIPKTSSGKTRRSKCKDDYLSRNLAVVFQWRKGDHYNQNKQSALNLGIDGNEVADFSYAYDKKELQLLLKQLIAKKLNCDLAEINIFIPFSRYGLDSLAVATIIGEMNSLLKVELAPTLIYEYPSIDLLSSKLVKILKKKGAEIENEKTL